MYMYDGTRGPAGVRAARGTLPAMVLAAAVAGCPGGIDPSLVPRGTGGNTGGGGVGNTGGGGINAQPCDPAPVFTAKICANAGCHDAMGTSANFDMASAEWQTHLVGVNPKGGGALASKCSSDGPYLVPNVLPAKGLFLDKLKDDTTPACGVLMPQVGLKLSAEELSCVQRWANALVTAAGATAAGPEDDGQGGEL